jgi:hypothetical protein
MKKILIVVLSLAMFCTACSTAWVNTLDAILAAAAPALIDILQIVAASNGKPMNSALAAKINTDSADIKTLASDFATAEASAAPGACQKLNAAVGVYQNDQQLVLQVAQVSDPNTQAKIKLLSDLVSGTVVAVTAVIPSCQANAKLFKVSPPLNLTNFTNQYNRYLLMKTGNPAVDALTPKLKLHQHSKTVRVLSLGTLK